MNRLTHASTLHVISPTDAERTEAPLAERAAQPEPLAEQPSLLSRRWVKWALGFGIWTLLGLLAVCQGVLWMAYTGRPVEWRGAVVGRLADWYTCAAFTPAFFWLVRRFPIDRRSWRSAVPIQLAATVVFTLLKYVLYVPLRNALSPEPGLSFQSALAGAFVFELMAFWAVLGIVHAIEYYRKFREREVRASQLEARLAQAQLEVLRTQLHPHFLFNTLHAVSTLMHRDVEAADEMITELSDLLRLTLRGGGAQEVPLAQELDILGRYIGIMRIRFRDRLTATTDVDPTALDALVPALILQPLVENAIRHGIAEQPGAGRLAIRARRESPWLVLEVLDDGAGLGAGENGVNGVKEGVGLANTRARLAQLYGAHHELRLAGPPDGGGGLVVTLRIPFRVACVGDGAEATG